MWKRPLGRCPLHCSADVAVIIVNYGTAHLAVQAVDSILERQHHGLGVEVHLVDNASPGDDAAILSRARDAWGDRVTLYLETTNHGFGRGNNLVLKALQERAHPPEKVYFLNPDARLETEVIAELAAFLDAHPQAAIVGSGINRPEDGAPVTCAFRFPSFTSEVVAAIGFGPLSRLFAGRAVPLAPTTPTGPVDWVAGASMMARFDALAEVGFFRPRLLSLLRRGRFDVPPSPQGLGGLALRRSPCLPCRGGRDGCPQQGPSAKTPAGLLA